MDCLPLQAACITSSNLIMIVNTPADGLVIKDGPAAAASASTPLDDSLHIRLDSTDNSLLDLNASANGVAGGDDGGGVGDGSKVSTDDGDDRPKAKAKAKAKAKGKGKDKSDAAIPSEIRRGLKALARKPVPLAGPCACLQCGSRLDGAAGMLWCPLSVANRIILACPFTDPSSLPFFLFLFVFFFLCVQRRRVTLATRSPTCWT